MTVNADLRSLISQGVDPLKVFTDDVIKDALSQTLCGEMSPDFYTRPPIVNHAIFNPARYQTVKPDNVGIEVKNLSITTMHDATVLLVDFDIVSEVFMEVANKMHGAANLRYVPRLIKNIIIDTSGKTAPVETYKLLAIDVYTTYLRGTNLWMEC